MSVLIKPTVLVGLGGTGDEIVRSVHSEYTRIHGDNPLFQSIIFDVDKKNENLEKVSNLEFVHLKVDQPDDYLAAINEGIYPNIKNWFSTDKIKWIGDLSDGAKKNRQLGRLATVINMDVIRKVLETKLKQVRDLSLRAELINKGYRIQDSLNVIIVSSLGGGSGSGMFIDVALNVRQLLGNEGTLIGYSVTPETFDINCDELAQIKANTYAACMELEHFMNLSKPFVYDY
jgi:hypothetical protein